MKWEMVYLDCRMDYDFPYLSAMKNKVILLTIALFIGFHSCGPVSEKSGITIGISKGAPEKYYGNYSKWLKTADSTVVCLDLYHMPIDSALMLLESCSGLLLSGGPDVHPAYYNMAEDTAKCGDIDHFRDSLEFALIDKAITMDLPILGICRGLQIFNISQGGSLYADIPADLDTMVTHRCPDTYNCFHNVRVEKGSGLHFISGVSSGTTNSNHHQGIRRIGDGLAPIARTDEGLIESIEYKNRVEKPFFLAVQWHPERMETNNPLSLPLANQFLKAAYDWKSE
jgi:putative glutamine amidotransferase